MSSTAFQTFDDEIEFIRELEDTEVVNLSKAGHVWLMDEFDHLDEAQARAVVSLHFRQKFTDTNRPLGHGRSITALR